ncbi:hypothetical protein BSM4216_1360 [Bacillus smithii]|nr:hypothetical protein BSM4216_1360 [Bacillus smithii]
MYLLNFGKQSSMSPLLISSVFLLYKTDFHQCHRTITY